VEAKLISPPSYYPVRSKDFSYFSVVLTESLHIVLYIRLETLNFSEVLFASVFR